MAEEVMAVEAAAVIAAVEVAEFMGAADSMVAVSTAVVPWRRRGDRLLGTGI
jgi:hypothetical protein